MGRLNSMYRSVGAAAHTVLHGRNMHPAARALSSLPVGMRGSASARLPAMKALKAAQTKTGKRVIGAGIGLATLGMVNRERPVGGYNPRRPIMPVPQNGRPM